MLPYIFSDLYQIAFVRTLQYVLRLFFGDQPCILSMLRQGTCHIVKGEAHIPGSVDLTGMPRMICLMAAVTGSKADITGLLHNMRGPFIVQDMVRLIIGQHRLLHEDPPKPGLRGKEKIFDKILLHVHVLPVELA